MAVWQSAILRYFVILLSSFKSRPNSVVSQRASIIEGCGLEVQTKLFSDQSILRLVTEVNTKQQVAILWTRFWIRKEHDSLSIKRNSDSLFVKNKGICLVYKKEIHGDPGDLFLVLELCLVRTSYFRFEAAWHGHGIKVFLVIMNSSSTNTVRLRSKVSVFNKKNQTIQISSLLVPWGNELRSRLRSFWFSSCHIYNMQSIVLETWYLSSRL